MFSIFRKNRDITFKEYMSRVPNNTSTSMHKVQRRYLNELVERFLNIKRTPTKVKIEALALIYMNTGKRVRFSSLSFLDVEEILEKGGHVTSLFRDNLSYKIVRAKDASYRRKESTWINDKITVFEEYVIELEKKHGMVENVEGDDEKV